MIERIVHSTDFSQAGIAAFHHALALALHHRARLDLVHVHTLDVAKDYGRFPHVRATLAKWGVIPLGVSREDVAALAGVTVNKVEIRDVDPVQGLTHHLREHPADLIVMASHARSAMGRLLKGSISGEVAQEIHAPILFVGPQMRGFVNGDTGLIALSRALVPVDHAPAPTKAVEVARAALDGLNVDYNLFHVGNTAPLLTHADGRLRPVRVLAGDPVATIVREAATADILIIPTEGRKSLFDRLRGSTVERVLHEASCPVLAIPAR